MSISLNGTDGVVFPDLSTQNTAATGFGFKSRIINGDMRIDQRNAGASVANTAGSGYTLDRWKIEGSQASKFTVQQNAGGVTPPAGYSNYLGVTSSSAYSVGASDYFILYQNIEANNIADVGMGLSTAVPITASFWVRSSLTGTFGGVFYAPPGNPSYPFTYTINTANTWEQKFVTIPGVTYGAWNSGSANGGSFVFGLGAGASVSGPAGSWVNTLYRSASGATSVVGTSGATFYITGVQLEKGSTATSFDYRDYGRELIMCQRYYETVVNQSTQSIFCDMYSSTPGASAGLCFTYRVVKRATPTMTVVGTFSVSGTLSGSPVFNTGVDSLYVFYSVASAGRAYWFANGNSGFTASAEL